MSVIDVKLCNRPWHDHGNLSSGTPIVDTEPLADLKAWLETLRTRQGRICIDLQKIVERAWCLAMTTTSPCERDFSHLLLVFQKRAASPLVSMFFLYFTLFAVYFTLFVLAFFKMRQGYGLYSSKFLVQEI